MFLYLYFIVAVTKTAFLKIIIFMFSLENGKLLCSSHLIERPSAAVFSAVSLSAFHVEMVFK